MSLYYSPFIDKKGSFVPLPKIRFSHVVQLEERNIEEGYQVEYKSQWDDNFLKKHLCQTITSFANSEGGWLFIGVADDTAKYIGIKKLRADFSQIIAQKLDSVSPIPKFESRFIRSPQNKQMGVLVVYIHEGLNPPYVCNGTVYLRNGSSKVPIKSGRVEIDKLVHKRESFSNKQKEFCINNLVDVSAKFPYCSIYLYNPYATFDINTLTENLKNMKETLSKTGYWQRLSYSSESVLCYSSDIISKGSITSITEFFANGNIKVMSPLFTLQKESRKAWASFINEQNPNVDVSEMSVADGFISFGSIQLQLQYVFEYLKNCGYHINDYYISFEYKNVGNTVLYFRATNDGESQNIKNTELSICAKNEIKTLPTYFIDDVNGEDPASISLQLLETNFAFPFGIAPNELRIKIIESMPLYQEKKFSCKFE